METDIHDYFCQQVSYIPTAMIEREIQQIWLREHKKKMLAVLASIYYGAGAFWHSKFYDKYKESPEPNISISEQTSKFFPWLTEKRTSYTIRLFYNAMVNSEDLDDNDMLYWASESKFVRAVCEKLKDCDDYDSDEDYEGYFKGWNYQNEFCNIRNHLREARRKNKMTEDIRKARYVVKSLLFGNYSSSKTGKIMKDVCFHYSHLAPFVDEMREQTEKDQI